MGRRKRDDGRTRTRRKRRKRKRKRKRRTKGERRMKMRMKRDLTRDWKIEMTSTRKSLKTRSEVKTAPRFVFAFLVNGGQVNVNVIINNIVNDK